MSLLKCVVRRIFACQQTLRTVSTARVCYNKPELVSPEKKAEDPLKILQDGTNHRVDNLEKRFLVWTGKYKTVDEVPPTVPQGTMEKARNKMRIKMANYMIFATVIGCIVFVISGKRAAKRGDSVQKMNMDWHNQIDKSSSK